MARHTTAFIYLVMDHWGKSKAPAQGRFELPTCRSTVEHANHQTTPTAPSRGSVILQVLKGRNILLLGGGGGSVKTAPPRVGHPQGACTDQRVSSLVHTDAINLAFSQKHKIRVIVKPVKVSGGLHSGASYLIPCS